MGRATQNAAAGVRLTREEYFELSARITAVRIAALEAKAAAAQRIMQAIERELAPVTAKQTACFDALATKYHLDPAVHYRLDEATLSLVPVNPPLVTD
jgi:hypothetical protein